MRQKSPLFLIALVVYLSVAGGAIGVLAKLAMPAFTPVTIVFFRITISLAAFAVMLFARGALGSTLRTIARRRRMFVALGVLGVFDAELVGFWGLRQTTAIHYDLIMNLSALAIVVSAAWLFRERVSRRDMILLGIALVGAAVVVTNGKVTLRDISQGALAGDALVFAAALGWGLYSTMGARCMNEEKSIDSLGVTFGSFLAGALIVLPLVLRDDSFGVAVEQLTVKTVGALLLLSVLSTAALFPLWFYFLKYYGGVWGGLVTLSENIGGVVFPMLFLGERFTTATAVGGALVVAAIVAKERKADM